MTFSENPRQKLFNNIFEEFPQYIVRIVSRLLYCYMWISISDYRFTLHNTFSSVTKFLEMKQEDCSI